jgi:hydroxymethylglutaryl-CoA lyase
VLQLPKEVLVAEVAPRDGLQSLRKWIDTDTKVRMIDRLSEAGFKLIEVTGFVHPRVIPNLRDAEEVFERIKRRPGTVYRALVPNARGAERASRAKVDEMLGLITVSPTYLRKNQNMTIDEAIEQGISAFQIADKAGISFVMALGMSMWCPYEGRVAEEKTLAVVKRFYEAGIRRFYLAGSVGMEDPRQVNQLIRKVYDTFPDVGIGFHVHNVSGYGQANVLAALDAGAHWIEGSICGIGGGIAMPTNIAVGNLPTEDIVSMLSEMGVDCGVDRSAAIAAAKDVSAMLDIEPVSYSARGGTREAVLEWGRSHAFHHPE